MIGFQWIYWLTSIDKMDEVIAFSCNKSDIGIYINFIIPDTFE